MKKLVILTLLLASVSVGFAVAEEQSPLSREVQEILDCKVSKAELKSLKELRRNHPIGRPRASVREVENIESLVGEFLTSPLPLDDSHYDGKYLRTVANWVRILSFCAAEDFQKREVLVDLVRRINETELLTKSRLYRHSAYAERREVPKNLFYAFKYLEDEDLERFRDGINYSISIDMVTKSSDELRGKVSSDFIYLTIPHIFTSALLCSDDSQAVLELRAYSHFIGAATQYAAGSFDVLKPDGTGFHHNTHYNGYMYCYQTWINEFLKLSTTPFRVKKESYERLKKAVISTYLMSTCSSDGYFHYANSLCGRHPFGGTVVSSSEADYDKLLKVGAEYYDGGIDTELASYYNYFYKSDRFKGVPEIAGESFHQFNYSPIGVYRKDNWVATMRSPTTNFWGAEIYNSANRFGRYQSHGTLEIIYEGGATKTGYPKGRNGKEDSTGGWDWNVVPGATTVHYAEWKEMMPKANFSDRFDQYSQTTNFAGALAWGKVGIFGAEFDQGDRWGAPKFEPTNLTYRKSVFAIDGLLISLGSDISSSGAYSDDMVTATNLYQAIDMKDKELYVNGEVMKFGSPKQVLDLSKDAAWILTPQTTGYIIPSGNDQLVIYNDEQSSPNQKGRDLTPVVANATKSYIKHGVKPTGKGYEFVVVPNTTKEKLKGIYKSVAGSTNRLYNVLSKDNTLHAVKHYASDIIAYCAFGAKSDLTFGYVSGVGSEMLLMERYDASKAELSMAVCNPNLRPEVIGNKNWYSTPTQTTITVKGLWSVANGDDSVSAKHIDGATVVSLTLSDGLPMELLLKTSR